MLLSQLVEINEKGSIASSVNFGMMDNSEMNLALCEEFIFNYDSRKPELSTVGILDALRRSYHSSSEPNIHLMIQDYGKGKSHFAVAIANFFKKSFDSTEVQGILHQVEVASANKNKGVAEGLKLFKQSQRHKHLVICLSGDRGGDIKKQFLQVLVKGLEAEGITDSLAQNTCSEPLRYLEGLDEENIVKAEEYLKSINYPDGDLNSIIRLLKENNPGAISTVKNLAYYITGFTPDFSANVDIEAILQDVIKRYCMGENAIFSGILILFDELNYYLQDWASDQVGAGGTALQNITNICENNKGKIALLSFTQFHPSRAIGISANAMQSYEKIATRLAPKDKTYDNPASSLELVLYHLLIQKESNSNWKEFRERWHNTLLGESRIAFEKRIKIYREKGWSLEEFNRHLTQGCFPLHPLTAYLLCNLDFTQDRTAIQFIKGYVKDFIQDELVEKGGKLNFIYPITLVDTFIENFSKESVYTFYKKALTLVAGSEDTEELTVLKALFLFYACGEKLTKPDREEHQEILASLTGLPKLKLKSALDSLVGRGDIIYYQEATKLYRFWEGVSPKGIEEDIEDKIKDKETSVNDVVFYSQRTIKTYLDETIIATQFVKDNKLVGVDWQFECKIYSINALIRALNSDQTLRTTNEKGIFAYVLAETQEELQEFRRTIDDDLSKSPIKNRIAVAIPSEETGKLDRVLLRIKTLKEQESSQKRLFGVAYEKLLENWEEQVRTQLGRIFKSCTYHCSGIDKIPLSEQKKPQRVISLLLQELYTFVPPVAEIDKMRSNHNTGSKIVGFVSKQLFADSLTPQTLPDQAYTTVIDTIFVSSWGLLKKTSQKYIVQEPTNEKVRAAWDEISQMADLGTLSEKTVNLDKIWKVLSTPPYGYSEYNFTILLAAWLAYHRNEVSLEGKEKLSARKGELVSRKAQSLQSWASPDTDILQKPATFVSDWIVKSKSKLIRRQKLEMPTLAASQVDYDQAQQYLKAVRVFLDSNEADSGEVAEVTKNKEQVITAVEQVENWLQPVVEAEAITGEVALEALVQLYPRLMQRLPAISLISNVISVQPTQQQRDRQTQALQNISNKIATFVEAAGKRSELLLTQEDCDAYKVEIQGVIGQINPITSLSPHLTDLIKILENAIRAAELKLTEIREQNKVNECFSRIQTINKSLNNYSTQQDYVSTRAEIETLARNIADGTPEAIEIQQILQNIDQYYNELSQKIGIWEERSAGVTSHEQIVDLFEEINKQERRFTEEVSKQKISALQELLKQELLKIQNKDDAEKLVRSELSTAQQKLQRIRDLPLNKLADAFQVYQELINTSLPTTEHAVSLEGYQKKLNEFKAQGRTVISDKFALIHNKKLSRLEDCEPLQEQLQTSQKILADVEDFADIKTNIERALENLEAQRQELQQQSEQRQKQAEDKQIMQDVCKYKSVNKFNTIYLCEEAISEIEILKNRLNEPEKYTAEIEQISKLIQEKITAYQQSLSDIMNCLKSVDNLADLSGISTKYAKLELVFKDSADYSKYQQLQPTIQFLENDLEQIQNLETRYQQCNDISSCNNVLETINNQQSTIHEVERFRERISKLEDNLRERIQTYTSELQEIEYNLEHITTVRDAQKLQEKLLKKSSRYLNSEAEEQYEAIKSELILLIELLQIVETGKLNTLQSCQAQFNKLQNVINVVGDLTPNLQQRIESWYAEIEQEKARILEQEKAEAQEWLKDLENQAASIYQLFDDTEKLEAANNLLKEIQIEKSQYISLLNPQEAQSLEYIKHRCMEEQQKHKANQILVLFRQLPRLQRQDLYERLAQYLSEETED
ncbi:hypothetical protein IQ247_07895 [Plectonema cf. radiosum LEGE 06105]|uniref:Uncharacterized protein n=1 Tax=Plectonema cf. radiosum LEGE 06105 TaxID=945769 RepID=A0A8J7EZ85_9CYAN|nr:hypothetical protein [Plectonema radiosum]MBE9212638.1 hypothetical protein [Plectonema cf. radiosum LEGE 06105]